MDEERCKFIENVPDDAKMFAYVWWCGDDYCDCSQAKILTYTERNGPAFRGPHTTIWEGEYHSEGEGNPNNELNRIAAHLRRHHNAFYHRIVWPWFNK